MSGIFPENNRIVHPTPGIAIPPLDPKTLIPSPSAVVPKPFPLFASPWKMQQMGSDHSAAILGGFLGSVLVEASLLAVKTLACSLFMVTSSACAVNALATDKEISQISFPFDELYAVKKPGPENVDGSETEDDDDEEEAEDPDDDEDEEEEGGEANGDEEGDPEDEPEANDGGNEDGDEDDDEDDDEDGEEEDDEEDEDEEDEEEEEDEDELPQPPTKKRK